MRARISLVVATAVVVGLGLTSCSLGGSPDRDTVSRTASGTPTTGTTASPTDSSTDAATGTTGTGTTGTGTPSAVAGPEVAAARSRFDAANGSLAASNGSAGDDAIVASLVAAGFDKQAMQITPDQTSIGRAADSIQVAVLVGSTCLLGQFRGGSYVGATAPVLSTGHCLVGTTKAIS